LPAKDHFHDTVKRALVKDGWTITGEQVKIIVEDRNLFVDIEVTNATSGLVVLIEVKELDNVPSPVEALASAVGKYFLYRWALDDSGISIPLYLAVSRATFHGILSEKLGMLSVDQGNILLAVFDPEREEIVQWLP
jgi:hypothetical protein